MYNNNNNNNSNNPNQWPDRIEVTQFSGGNNHGTSMGGIGESRPPQTTQYSTTTHYTGPAPYSSAPAPYYPPPSSSGGPPPPQYGSSVGQRNPPPQYNSNNYYGNAPPSTGAFTPPASFIPTHNPTSHSNNAYPPSHPHSSSSLPPTSYPSYNTGPLPPPGPSFSPHHHPPPPHTGYPSGHPPPGRHPTSFAHLASMIDQGQTASYSDRKTGNSVNQAVYNPEAMGRPTYTDPSNSYGAWKNRGHPPGHSVKKFFTGNN